MLAFYWANNSAAWIRQTFQTRRDEAISDVTSGGIQLAPNINLAAKR